MSKTGRIKCPKCPKEFDSPQAFKYHFLSKESSQDRKRHIFWDNGGVKLCRDKDREQIDRLRQKRSEPNAAASISAHDFRSGVRNLFPPGGARNFVTFFVEMMPSDIEMTDGTIVLMCATQESLTDQLVFPAFAPNDLGDDDDAYCAVYSLNEHSEEAVAHLNDFVVSAARDTA